MKPVVLTVAARRELLEKVEWLLERSPETAA